MNRFKDILCVVEVDGTHTPVIERAVTLAENNQARLTVVNVVPNIAIGQGIPGAPADIQAKAVAASEKQLSSLIEPYQERLEIETKVLSGVPFLETIREVLRNHRDLLIKAPETADWLNRLFSSDDMHLLRKCPCPVWLIKPGVEKSYRRILAAVDLDDSHPADEQKTREAMNRQILHMASSLALSEFAELHIVHAWDAPGEETMYGGFVNISEEKIATYVDQVQRQHEQTLDTLIREVAAQQSKDALDYLKPQTHLVKGSPRKEIPALAKQIEADLVVMGTVARTGIPGFIMGNTAETILNQIDCSVLAIKPPGFTTPVTLEE